LKYAKKNEIDLSLIPGFSDEEKAKWILNSPHLYHQNGTSVNMTPIQAAQYSINNRTPKDRQYDIEYYNLLQSAIAAKGDIFKFDEISGI
jgi:hypothetical protein